jgi:hypothetical protein
VSASSSYYYLFQQNCSSSQSSCSRLAAAAAANHHSNVLECGLNTTKFVSASQILILSSIYFVEREWLGALLERSLGNLRPKNPKFSLSSIFIFPSILHKRPQNKSSRVKDISPRNKGKGRLISTFQVLFSLHF